MLCWLRPGSCFGFGDEHNTEPPTDSPPSGWGYQTCTEVYQPTPSNGLYPAKVCRAVDLPYNPAPCVPCSVERACLVLPWCSITGSCLLSWPAIVQHQGSLPSVLVLGNLRIDVLPSILGSHPTCIGSIPRMFGCCRVVTCSLLRCQTRRLSLKAAAHDTTLFRDQIGRRITSGVKHAFICEFAVCMCARARARVVHTPLAVPTYRRALCVDW